MYFIFVPVLFVYTCLFSLGAVVFVALVTAQHKHLEWPPCAVFVRLLLLQEVVLVSPFCL